VKLAELIRQERERRGWSVRKLAGRASVDPSAVSRIENGKQIGHAETLARIAQALEIDPALIQGVVSGDDDVSPPASRSLVDTLEEALTLARRREGSGEGPILVDVLPQPMSAGPGAPETDVPQVPFWPAPADRGHMFRAVEVVGDCLEPRVMRGHFAIVDLTAVDQAKPGDLVAAQHDGEYLVKILEARDGLLYLVALQGREPIQVDDRFTRLIGVVKGAYYRP
jgi:transcriptional regulator with XRE-family HTH domain